MPPMDSSASYYEGPWLLGNNCPDLFDVKTEDGSFSNPLLNAISGGESCMSKVEQVVYQRAANLSSAPHLSSLGGVSTIISDSLMQGGLDHVKPVKCAFSTVTSARRVDPCLNGLVSSLPMETRLSEPRRFPQKDGWSVSVASNPKHFTTGPFEGLGGGCLVKPFGGASAATESTNNLQKESQIVQRNNVKSRSDDTSLDDILTTSSGVSSTSVYLAREQEDDDGICTTSAEPSSQLGRSPPLGVTAGVGAIALTHKDEQQQQMSGLTGVSHSPDQRDLGSPSSVSRGAQQDQESILSNDSGCFPVSDGVTIPTVVPLDMKAPHGDLGALVGDGGWCKKELKEAVSSGGFLQGQIQNHVNAAIAPDIATSSFLQRSTSANICHPQSDIRNLAVLNAALNTVVADKSVATFREAMVRSNTMADHLTHAMLLRAPFASINMADVENSRPKRRNVKISKDPQSVAARHRRERISDRIRVLQRLVPGGTKMDTASMLDEAIAYVKYLKAQVQTLETVSSAAAGFDPRLIVGPGSLYRTGIPGLPFGPMAIDCSSVSQGIGSAQNDFNDFRDGFPSLSDGNFPVQFCH